MEPQTVTDCVNILGLRLGDFTKTETCRYLKDCGTAVGLMLPGKTSADQIRTAPRARCNIVVHPVGLPLAKEMQKKFGTPYVLFERYADPERIFGCYRRLFEILEKPLPEELEKIYRDLAEKTKQAQQILAGKSYISGNTALCNYELHSFLAEKLGMKPLLLQISDLDEDSVEFRNELLKHCDPYVTRAANIGAMQYLYPLLKPDFNIGAGMPMEMRKNSIATVRMMNAYNTLGFEVCNMVLDAFLAAEKESQMMRGGMGK
jgi:nitrogenase molybdenum-cofactor synthesis protein NifE